MGPDYWRKELQHRGGGTERNPETKTSPPRGRDVLVQDVLREVAVSGFEEYLRVRDTRGLEELVSCGLNGLGHASISESAVRQASSGQGKRALSLLLEALCVELIWKTTKVCSARCGVCMEVGPSPFPLQMHLVFAVSK